eukprot:ctg_2109.g552
MSGGVGRHQRRVVHQREQRGLQQLAHRERSVHSEQRHSGETHGALVQRPQLHRAGGAGLREQERQERLQLIGAGKRRVSSDVLDMLLGELERVLQVAQHVGQAGEHGVLALEGIAAEEEVKGGRHQVSSLAEIGVSHGDLV